MQQEYWILNQLDELALLYLEIKNHVNLFLILFRIIKKNKLINEKNTKTVLRYATDLPSLENRFRNLVNTVLDLEINKKELSEYRCHAIKKHSYPPTEQSMRQCF
jgi:dsDNA-specific endonuclease/ATPase MutS2